MDITEVLTSWQGDDTVQFVELQMLANGQNDLSNGAQLVIDDATASSAGHHVFTFQTDVANGVTSGRVLISTTRAATVSGVTPDFQVTDAFLPKLAGRICYVGNDPQNGLEVVDCVAYGKYTAGNGRFGRPTPLTPDDRSLRRIGTSGNNRADWGTSLTPAPQNNAGQTATMPTLCGDGQVSQGEQCDGTQLAGQTCQSLGFVKGKLACKECHFDTTGCTLCGNDQIDGKEQCDTTDFGTRTCQTLGFTGGTLTCSDKCILSTESCDPTFNVPGGATGPDCLGEWQITNAAARPGITGAAPAKQRCTDGDTGCDADTVTGQCTFTLAICTDQDDERIKKCPSRSVESWTLIKPTADGSSADAAFIDTVLAAVGALGPSTTAGAVVTFSPPLDPTPRCTSPFSVVVPTKGTNPGTRVVKARIAGIGGKPRAVDPLKLVCVP